MRTRQISIPTCLRIKAGALDRVGLYLRRAGLVRAAVIASQGLPEGMTERLYRSCREQSVALVSVRELNDNSLELAEELLHQLPSDCQALVGLGGGKALDLAKYVAAQKNLPYFALPTSLSNDGFCSPQASLTVAGRRQSLGAAMPFGVVVDTEVCLSAPEILWLSGVGDLVSKLSAVRDWKLAFHFDGTPLDDFAALLSDATVQQFWAAPGRDLESVKSLATALMLNGVAMEIAASSRPASGSEHLISHALDRLSQRPRLHGLQVGLATYFCLYLQEQERHHLGELFDRVGFWRAIQQDPMPRTEWRQAVALAPDIKKSFHTILNARDGLSGLERLWSEDERFAACFVD